MKTQYAEPDKTVRRRRGYRLACAGRANAPSGSELEARKLVQELQLHKIELEMQNEELARAQGELKASWSRIDQRVVARTAELTRALESLSAEVQVRYQAEQSLQGAFTELEVLKDRLLAENAYLQQQVDRDVLGEFPGPSRAMALLRARIDAAAAGEAPVLLLGEAGTCKRSVARAIHDRSPRRRRPFVILGCASLPPEVLETAVFGQDSASARHRIGLFELGHLGTLFVGEVALVPPALQSKLLVAIREWGLPSADGHPPEIRVIASSNRDLREEVRQGRFREDLYACLKPGAIPVPALREHREDIPSLVEAIMAKGNRILGKDFRTVSQRTLDLLMVKAWPGNVKELRALVELAMLTSPGPCLELPERQGQVSA